MYTFEQNRVAFQKAQRVCPQVRSRVWPPREPQREQRRERAKRRAHGDGGAERRLDRRAERLPEDRAGALRAHPLLQSLAESTDAATKLAQVVPEFPYTVDFWTMRGHDLDSTKSVVSQLERKRGQASATDALNAILASGAREPEDGLFDEEAE